MKQPAHEDNKLGNLNPAFMKHHHLTIFAADPLAQRQTEMETWIRPATSSRDEARQAGKIPVQVLSESNKQSQWGSAILRELSCFRQGSARSPANPDNWR